MKTNLLIYLIFFVFLSCKKEKTNNIFLENSFEKEASTKKTRCIKYDFLKWLSTENDREQRSVLYISNSYKVELKRFLNEEENKAGFLLYINGSKADVIYSDFSFKPFIYKCNTNDDAVLFIEEADENGSFSYRIYTILHGAVTYSGTLNIVPNENHILIEEFIELQKLNNRIIINLLTDSYFNSKIFKSEESSNFGSYIDINSLKLIDNLFKVASTVYPQVETYLNVRSAPSSKGAIVAEAYPKDALTVLEVLDGWLKVSLNGIEGYVSSDYVK